MGQAQYDVPSLKVAGSLHDVTLVTNKYQNHTPDGIIYHPSKGVSVPLTS